MTSVSRVSFVERIIGRVTLCAYEVKKVSNAKTVVLKMMVVVQVSWVR